MSEQQIAVTEMLYNMNAINAIRKCAHQHGLLQDAYSSDHMDMLDGMIRKLLARNDEIHRQQATLHRSR